VGTKARRDRGKETKDRQKGDAPTKKKEAEKHKARNYKGGTPTERKSLQQKPESQLERGVEDEKKLFNPKDPSPEGFRRGKTVLRSRVKGGWRIRKKEVMLPKKADPQPKGPCSRFDQGDKPPVDRRAAPKKRKEGLKNNEGNRSRIRIEKDCALGGRI